MAPYWTVKQLADYCELSRSAIQRRATRFSWALSDNASPGSDRNFTPRDIAIMLEIDEQVKGGNTYDETEASLRDAVARGVFDDAKEFPPERRDDTGELIPIAEHNRLMERAEMIVNQAVERAEKAEADLLGAKERIAYLEGQIEELRRQVNRDEIVDANRKIARLELMLELEREKVTRLAKTEDQ